MLAYNRRTGHKPIVLHAPGSLHQSRRWKGLAKDALAGLNGEAHEWPASTVIITWNNQPTECLLERFLDKFGIENAHLGWSHVYGFSLVLGRGLEHWSNTGKGALALEVLREVHTEYVIGLDGYDVILLEHPAEMVRRFTTQFDCELLFNAASAPWPSRDPLLSRCRAFEDQWWDETDRYLNAGTWIGRREYVIGFLERVQETARTVKWSRRLRHMEQHLVRYTAFPDEYPAVDLDRRGHIFQHMRSGWTDLEFTP